MQYNDTYNSDANLPKSWQVKPIFALTKQQGVLVYKNEEWRTGVDEIDGSPAFVSGLTIEHGVVLMGMMSFQPLGEPQQKWNFSLKKLSEIVYGSYGSNQYAKLKTLLKELIHCHFSIKNTETGITRTCRVLRDIETHSIPSRRNKDVDELWLDCVEIHPTYYEMIQTLTETQYVDVSIFKKITGNLAKSIYMILPSRAYHHGQNSPFMITFDNLLKEVRVKPELMKSKSLRKRQMDNNAKTSIINKLNGSKILGGHTMHVDYYEKDDDYVLRAWVEKAITTKKAARSLSEKFFKEEVGVTDENWRSLVKSSNEFNGKKNVHYWPDFEDHENHSEWLYKIYYLAIADDAQSVQYFVDVLASESDGKAGHGAMVNKFKKLVKKHYGVEV
jgi:hypothetical protein